jgi:hypothetical protein
MYIARQTNEEHVLHRLKTEVSVASQYLFITWYMYRYRGYLETSGFRFILETSEKSEPASIPCHLTLIMPFISTVHYSVVSNSPNVFSEAYRTYKKPESQRLH